MSGENIAGNIKGKKGNYLVVRSGRLYEVRCLSDIFFVTAQNKDQIRKLLFARGGALNLSEYTIKRHHISHCEMIYAEVDDYKKVLEQSKFIDKNDLTDYSIDCDE